MLFDLRGPGRRRTVQVIYLSLALLMGGGLVLFGVGGNISGGLFDAFNSGNGGGSDTLAKEARVLERRVATVPTDQHAWLRLAQTQFQDASSGDNFDQTAGFTASGKAKLRAAVRAWEHYLALDPKKPDDAVASVMVQADAALGRYAKAATAMEIVTAAQPSSGTFAQLAQLAYAAGQTRKGDLSAAKAISLAPPDQRNTIKSELDSAKSQAAGSGSGAAAGTQTTG
jgi:hypothetical protein